MPAQRRPRVIDDLLEPLQLRERLRAADGGVPVVRIAREDGAVPFQRRFVVAGLGQGVAQVVVDVDGRRAAARALPQDLQPLVPAAQPAQRRPQVRPAGGGPRMRLQDGAVRGGGGFEIAAGMQPDGVLEGAARVRRRGGAALAHRTPRGVHLEADPLDAGQLEQRVNAASSEGAAALHPLTTTTNPRTERTDRLSSRTR